MRKIVLLLSATLQIALTGFSQAPNIIWNKTFGGIGNDIMQDIYCTADGNYILLGIDSLSGGDITCTTKGKHDTWVIKMDPSGNILWQQCFGGTKEEGNPSSQIIQTSDGGYIFQTETWSSDGDVVGHHDLSDAWTVKLNSTGAIQWSHSFGGSNWDVPRRILELPGKRYFFLSRSTSSDGDVPPNIDPTNFDAWAFITDSSGNVISNHIYGGTGDDDLSDAIRLPNGNLALFGQTSSHDGDLTGLPVDGTDAWLLVIDTLGNIISNRVYGQINYEDFITATATDDGGFIAFGESENPTIPIDKGAYHGSLDFWVVKLDASYDIQWQGMYGGSAKEQMRDAVKVSCSDGYYLTGTTLSQDGDINENLPKRNWWIIHIASDGTLLWSKALGGSAADYSYAITNDGIAVGGTYSNDDDVTDSLIGNADGWVVKLEVPVLTATISPTGTLTQCKGTDVTLTCNNTGSDLSYQWRKDAANLAGATFQSYTTSQDDGDYDVVLTSTDGCTDISDATTLDFLKKPKATITPLGSLDICSTGSVALQANSGTNYTYSWKKNGKKISGATNPVYTATSVGDYKVKVTNADGCSKTSKATTVYSSCKEISAITEDNNQMVVYPNPFSSIVNIELMNDSRGKLFLYDVTEKLLLTKNISGKSQLDLSSFAGGSYLLEYTDGKTVYRQKVLKQ